MLLPQCKLRWSWANWDNVALSTVTVIVGVVDREGYGAGHGAETQTQGDLV